MGKCFVIQPFDNDKFDKRFVDVFQPAIIAAGLEAYRIDKDLAVRIPIDDIERGILESDICFAEITLDNPNVWYELGFAYACGKDVVLVCSDERPGNKFPFDIQHKLVLTYKTGSISDFQHLQQNITNKIVAFQSQSRKIQKLSESPVVDTEGLKSHEIALLICLTENQVVSEDTVSVHYIKSQMTKAGYTDIATSVGIKTLVKMGFVVTRMEVDEYDNNYYPVAKMTEQGENWVLQNQDKLVFRIEKVEKIIPTITPAGPDDLPF